VRVGLVLGAGGVLGGAWLVGALNALSDETGWDPGSAEYIVGTSAGSMVGALCAAGVPPWFMLAHSTGEVGDDRRPSAAGNGRRPAEGVIVDQRPVGSEYRLAGVPVLGPGSWRLALGSLARPYRYSPTAVLAGWLPRGVLSTEPLKETIKRVADGDWAPHPNLWIMACDYESGRRTAFGRRDAPPAQLADAVAASCAIPGFYRPVRIGGRRYVDGGVHSMSNLDVLADQGLDLVICLNPMSSLHAPEPRTLGERAASVLRQASGRRLGSEARRVRAAGTEVILIQPTVHELDAMGTNLMSSKRRREVTEVGAHTVAKHLRETDLGDRLSALPHGLSDLIKRPEGPLTGPPDFAELARLRWQAIAGVG
jgi:NTE family protein